MAFSVFSKPLTNARLGGYAGVGAAAGALLAGEDNRTAGAVAGGTLGAGVGAAHMLQGTGAWQHAKGIPWVMSRSFKTGSGFFDGVQRAGDTAYRMGKTAAYAGLQHANVAPELSSGIGKAASGISRAAKFLSGLRK